MFISVLVIILFHPVLKLGKIIVWTPHFHLKYNEYETIAIAAAYGDY